MPQCSFFGRRRCSDCSWKLLKWDHIYIYIVAGPEDLSVEDETYDDSWTAHPPICAAVFSLRGQWKAHTLYDINWNTHTHKHTIRRTHHFDLSFDLLFMDIVGRLSCADITEGQVSNYALARRRNWPRRRQPSKPRRATVPRVAGFCPRDGWAMPQLFATTPFFPKSVSTLRGSYGKSKGWGWIRVHSLVPGIFAVVHVHFDCAGSHREVYTILGPGFSPDNSRIKLLLWHVHVHFDCAGSHKTVVPVLVPSMTILQEFHGAPLEDPDEILSEVLAWSCDGPYEKILWRFGWHPLKGPRMILHRS